VLEAPHVKVVEMRRRHCGLYRLGDSDHRRLARAGRRARRGRVCAPDWQDGLRSRDSRSGTHGCGHRGGLVHMALQYAVAMGLHIVAVDVDGSHLDLARKVGAKVTVNDRNVDPRLTSRRRSAADTGCWSRKSIVCRRHLPP